MMEVPVWRTDKRYSGIVHTFTRLNELLDLTPLEPDEWHAIVLYHRVVHDCMSDELCQHGYPLSYAQQGLLAIGQASHNQASA